MESLAIATVALIHGASFAQQSSAPQAIETRIYPLEFTHDFANGYPNDATGKVRFAYFRFCQPTEACLDRSWPLPDFDPIQAQR